MSALDLGNQTADPLRTSAGTECLVRVYVWDNVVRATHWIIALCIFVLACTGFYIGNPFVIVPGEAGDHFLMGTIKAVHFYTATVFVNAVLVRVYWSFFGSAPARWPNFLPVTKRRFQEMAQTLGFYLFVRKTFPAVLSHNPLAGLAYSAVVVLYAVEILTGLALYGASAHMDSPMHWFAPLVPFVGGLQVARWIHHAVMWLILGFFVHHLYSAALAAHVEKNGILESIFTGWKWVRVDTPDPPP